MTKHDYKQSAYYLIYLIRCVLNDKIPTQEKIEKMDLSQIYSVAKAHSLTAIAAYALESAGIKDERFRQEKGKAIRKNITMDIEREKVISELEKVGIWYMPLKGIILQNLYPMVGMRQMADNDILCDETKMSCIKEIMEELGFETKIFGKSHQDVYEKPPICNFEMHSCLLETNSNEHLYNYYKNIKQKLIKDSDNLQGYHFSNEDFYIYMVVHEYKHFMATGTGLRSLLDTYLFLNAYNTGLDWDYIYIEINKLKISDFEHSNRELSMKVFRGHTLNQKETKLLDYYIFSGTYGVLENRIYNQIGHEAKISKKFEYILSRVKISEMTIKEFYPFFYTHKKLRPLLYTYKLFDKFIHGRKALLREIKSLFKKKTTE